ncbi:hypothetical protein Clacol_002395 [Clathrus columnatus]|uniref:XPG-I domain-containing protein n=1 Tax=Clathrus columnatus TaxID=1419009 RepID=A0AAV5A415_9AGAM|nr:hypothetical protein Clacol_002395 [Clathrus columnatus]
MPVAPLFMFNGPNQPKKLHNEKKGVVATFGFETLMAPGEAEVTLAQLNSAGIIDAILSDDIDCFLFGAKTVLHNVTIKNSPYGEYVHVYSSDVLEQKGFCQEELIFIALLSGGDYDRGLPDCSITTASQLRFLGFGKALQTLQTMEPFEQLLSEWWDELHTELETNTLGALSQKNCKAANNITSSFPPREVIHSYFHPSIFNHAEIEYFSQNLWQNKLEL